MAVGEVDMADDGGLCTDNHDACNGTEITEITVPPYRQELRHIM
jgi:hypothetical protein